MSRVMRGEVRWTVDQEMLLRGCYYLLVLAETRHSHSLVSPSTLTTWPTLPRRLGKTQLGTERALNFPSTSDVAESARLRQSWFDLAMLLPLPHPRHSQSHTIINGGQFRLFFLVIFYSSLQLCSLVGATAWSSGREVIELPSTMTVAASVTVCPETMEQPLRIKVTSACDNMTLKTSSDAVIVVAAVRGANGTRDLQDLFCRLAACHADSPTHIGPMNNASRASEGLTPSETHNQCQRQGSSEPANNTPADAGCNRHLSCATRENGGERNQSYGLTTDTISQVEGDTTGITGRQEISTGKQTGHTISPDWMLTTRFLWYTVSTTVVRRYGDTSIMPRQSKSSFHRLSDTTSYSSPPPPNN
ncbi:hypothetical protein J6590_017986 [Homalodisca vitripennis]|nr:hypothetical protein J6590_017986 [Homalodisca vitripennis]